MNVFGGGCHRVGSNTFHRRSIANDVVQTGAEIVTECDDSMTSRKHDFKDLTAHFRRSIHVILRDDRLDDGARFRRRLRRHNPRVNEFGDARRVTARRFEFVDKRRIAVAISAQTARHSGVESVHRQLDAEFVGVDVDAGPRAQSRVRLRADRHRSHVHDVFDFVRKFVRMAVDLKRRSADERVFRLVDVDVDAVALDGDGEIVRLVAMTSENEFARRFDFH